MAAANKRICKTCGAEYEYCPTCAKYASLPKWMWKCDTEICNDVFEAVSAYKMGIKNKDVVESVIEKHNIKDYSIFNNSFKTFLSENFPIRTKKNKNKKMDIDLITVDETPIIEEVIELPIVDGVEFVNEGISEE